MPRKKPAPIIVEPVKQLESEVEITLGPVSSKMSSTKACCIAGASAFCMVVFLYFLSFGLLQHLGGFGGFALAAETKQTFEDRAKLIGDLRVDLTSGFAAAQRERDTLRADIINAQRQVMSRIVIGNLIAIAMRYCEAVRAIRQGESDAYAIQLADLQAEYQTYVGNPYPLRPCQ